MDMKSYMKKYLNFDIIELPVMKTWGKTSNRLVNW